MWDTCILHTIIMLIWFNICTKRWLRTRPKLEVKKRTQNRASSTYFLTIWFIIWLQFGPNTAQYWVHFLCQIWHKLYVAYNITRYVSLCIFYSLPRIPPALPQYSLPPNNAPEDCQTRFSFDCYKLHRKEGQKDQVISKCRRFWKPNRLRNGRRQRLSPSPSVPQGGLAAEMAVPRPMPTQSPAQLISTVVFWSILDRFGVPKWVPQVKEYRLILGSNIVFRFY